MCENPIEHPCSLLVWHELKQYGQLFSTGVIVKTGGIGLNFRMASIIRQRLGNDF
jgi:hypothetical protein